MYGIAPSNIPFPFHLVSSVIYNSIICPVLYFQVVVTEILGGGQFYVQTVGDQKISSIQQQLAALNLQEAPIIGAYNPKKGDIVLAQFSADNSWNRAMVSCNQKHQF